MATFWIFLLVNPQPYSVRIVKDVQLIKRKNMETAKGFLYLVVLMAYLIGTINGIGYSIYIGQWPTAISVAVLAVLAFPVVRNIFKEWVK